MAGVIVNSGLLAVARRPRNRACGRSRRRQCGPRRRALDVPAVDGRDHVARAQARLGRRHSRDNLVDACRDRAHAHRHVEHGVDDGSQDEIGERTSENNGCALPNWFVVERSRLHFGGQLHGGAGARGVGVVQEFRRSRRAECAATRQCVPCLSTKPQRARGRIRWRRSSP